MKERDREMEDNTKDIVPVKKKRGGSKGGALAHNKQLNFGEEYVKPGDNSTYLRYAMVGMNLPPIDISDPKQVENRIMEYFQFCIDHDRKPNIKGLGNWVGVDAETIMRWRRGDFRAETHQPVLKKAIAVLEEMWWDYGYDGKVNPANWIFIGKNAFGMKDQQDLVLTPNQPIAEAQNPDQIAERYALLTDKNPENEE